MSLKNVDDLLVQEMSGVVPEPTPLTNDISHEEAPEQTSEPTYDSEPVAAEVAPEPEHETVDNYGTEIPKQEKVYTESEVQAMIRDRLSRGKQAEPQPQEAPKKEFDYDPSNSDSWEVQLESFIEHTLTKREQKQQQENWQKQEQETQANFEIRFNQGASKYTDFEQVVMGKPLTPQMVIATRGMDDPAAFIYAAAKTQAPELDRISKIGDPYAQAIELGRLEERMRKARGSVSKAPRPIDTPKGDVTEVVEKKWSIDDKLRQAEAESKKERMRGRTQ